MMKSLEKTESKDQKSRSSSMEHSLEKSEIINEDSPPSKEKECVHDSNTCNSLEVSLEETESKIEDSPSSKEKECVHASATCNSMEVSPEKSDITIDDLLSSILEEEYTWEPNDEFLKKWGGLIDAKGNFIKPDPDEERELRRQWAESEGFDVTIRAGMLDSFVPYPNLDNVPDFHRQLAESCGKVAIAHYNKNKNEKMEFVGLLKVNIDHVAGQVYYLTFEAKDGEGPSLEFQAKVWCKLSDEREVYFCRKKACSDQSVQGDV